MSWCCARVIPSLTPYTGAARQRYAGADQYPPIHERGIGRARRAAKSAVAPAPSGSRAVRKKLDAPSHLEAGRLYSASAATGHPMESWRRYRQGAPQTESVDATLPRLAVSRDSDRRIVPSSPAYPRARYCSRPSPGDDSRTPRCQRKCRNQNECVHRDLSCEWSFASCARPALSPVSRNF